MFCPILVNWILCNTYCNLIVTHHLYWYPKKEAFWQLVIGKVQDKLDKWKRYNLSRGGRVTLCKSVLAHLPTYYMSLFLMLEKVITFLE